MTTSRNSSSSVRIVLLTLTSFLSLTAIAGGIGLITGAVPPPLEMLNGSPFSDYTIPGLALLILVGGLAGTSAILLMKNHSRSLHFTLASACSILIFECVEIMEIGSPAGVARNLQIFYIGVGVIIALLGVLGRLRS
jgi:hypothetical protein